MKTVFLRAIEAQDKAAALITAIRMPVAALGNFRFEVDASSFASVPHSPFAYWVSERLRSIFKEHPPFEALGRAAKQGLSTADDFRFVRLSWEIESGRRPSCWFPFAKGGSHSRYYSDVFLVENWLDGGREVYVFNGIPFGLAGAPIRNPEHYFRPGLTWPRRTQSGLALRVMPAGCIFADKGPAAFVAQNISQELLALLATVNSSGFRSLVDLQMAFGSFEVGVIQRTPVPDLTTADKTTLAALANRAWSLKRSLDTRNETSHAFTLPALLHVEGEPLTDRSTAWSDRMGRLVSEIAAIQTEIDSRCFDLYGIDEADRQVVADGFGSAGEGAADDDDADGESDEADATAADTAILAAELVSWAIGVALGRFDVGLATGAHGAPAEPEPFDPLPVCSPGMLQNEQGLPLTKEEVGRLQNAGQWHYPLDIPWDGILVDDPGHPLDIECRVQRVLEVIWKARSEAIEREACEILGVATLRDYFRKPGAFFDDHLKRYSKSRRQAPIYWPLSSSGGNYTIWLYYHRFRRDTLFQALNDFAKPKLQHERLKLDRLRHDAGSQPARNQRDCIEAQESLVSELEGFVEELARVAPLWNPDLNDGVIINFAALWRMIGHTPWRKSVKECWDTLCAGDYDWSHLAMHLWPDRVVPKCDEDASLAIAHGVDETFWEKDERDRLVKKAPPPGGWRPVIERLVAERASQAVKAALESLLSAPSPSGRTRRGRRGNIHA